MSDATSLFNYAELSFAAYATLQQGPTGSIFNLAALRALTDEEVSSPTEFNSLAFRYPTIVTQYSDSVSGFSATILKDASGNLTLAIRGTESDDLNDLEADAYIAGAGAAYTQIVAMVNWWKKVSSPDGQWVTQYRLARYDAGSVPQGAVVLQTEDSRVLVLEAADSVQATGELTAALGDDADGKIDVTGHSLGGHLAMAFSTLFANQVGQTVTFNAPGFIDGSTNQAFFEELGGVVPTDASVTNLTNVIADEALVGEQPFSPIAGLWSRPGDDVNISIERQWLSDEPDASSPWNHSMFVLADSLAIYKLLQDLAPALTEEQYKQILNQAAQGTAAGYERIVDTLEAFFDINETLLPSGNMNRELLYQAIYGVKGNLTYQTWLGQLEIRPTVDDAGQLLVKSQDAVEGLAYRYAIAKLNPLVLLAPGLYASYEPGGDKDGLLDLYDRDTNPFGITQVYLDQRADFLERKLYITALDLDKYYQDPLTSNPPDQRGQDYQAQARHYEDRASGFIASTGSNPDSLQHFLFGREGPDELRGAGRIDYLYGGAGTDYLEGKFGDDHLEGGLGMDLYAYNAPANDGNDTILDIDGKGVLRFTGPGGTFSVIAEASIQNSTTEWGSADGKFIYTKETNGSGGTDLVITMSGVTGGSMRLKDFRDGDFGIRLWEARDNPATTRNVTGTEQVDQLYGDRLPPAGGDRIEGLGGNDVILADRPGGAADNGVGDDDWVIAGDGRDDVDAGAGNDLVEAGGDGELGGDIGGDLVYGGTGDDQLYADGKVVLSDAITQGNTAASLTQKGDVLSGGAGDDWIVGGAARDALLGGGGGDLIVGGAGDDDIWGDVGDVAAVFAWSVTRDDGSGGGNVEARRNGFVSADTSGGGADVIYAGRGIDWVFAGAGDDFIDGGADSDVIFGEAGSDIVLGGQGDDYLIGDNPGVVGSAEEGDDYLEGGDGTDYLQGDGGADILVGGRGNDTLAGGAGKDVYVFKVGDGLDTIIDVVTGPEASVIVHERGYDPNTLKIMPGSMIIDLGGGDSIHFATFDENDPNAPDAFETFSFGDGTRLSFADMLAIGFTIEGTSGDDDGVANPVVVGTAFRDNIRAFEGNDEVQGREGDDDIDGGSGNDRLFGGGGNDVLTGGSGHDAVSGEAGDDSLYGDLGNDWLWGGAGNDYLDGGGGFDQLFGGAGDDSYKFNIGSNVLDTEGAVRVVFADIGVIYEIAPEEISLRRQVINGAPVYTIGYSGPGASGTQEMFVRLSADAQLAEFEFADGTVFDHESLLRELWVDQALIVGTAGDDSIDGYAGDDFLQGGEGNDSLSGHKGNDRLEGGDGNDTLLGGTGDDLLIAGAGADVLDGGAGDDQLDGGSGDDTYLIGANAGRDRISEGGAGDFDTVIFEGLRADATLLRLPSGDLSVVFADGSTLTVAGQYTNPALQVERLVFGDNATVEIAELDALTVAPITGTSGDDSLIGTQYGDTLQGLEGSDFLDGGAGDDQLEGGPGADTYRLRLAGGVDRAVDDGAATSIIQLDPGIGFTHLAVTEAGNDLVVSVPGTDSGMVLTDYYLGQTNWTVRTQSGEQKTVPELIGYLGTITPPDTPEEFEQQYIDNARRQYLAYLASFGNSGDIQINVQAPSDAATIFKNPPYYETGSGGTYHLNIGDITGGPSANVLDFRASGLAIADAGAGDDLIINQGWGFDNTSPFVSIGSFLNGGAGNDAILGTWAADIIIGGDGSDFMDGSQGNDVYVVFQTDSGVDIIDEVSGDWSRQPDYFADTNSGRYSTDSLVFVDLASADATLSIGLFDTRTINFEGFGRVYATLDIDYGTGLVRVVLPEPGALDVYYNNGDLAGIETISFSDGVTLTLDGIFETFEIPPLGAPGDERTLNGSSGDDQLLPFARDQRTSIFGFGGDDYSEGGFTDDYLDGGDGRDVIYGLAGNDVLAGGPGDDMLVGGAGSDTYLFNVGDGIDTVFDPLGSNSVRFGAGIVSEDLSLDVGSLLLRIGGTGDAIHFESFDAQNPFGLRDVDRFVFSDASELSYEDLLARGFDISGTSGGDVLSGTAIVDRIRGGLGDDVLAGGLGSDTYLYDTGDGADTIQEGTDPSSTDVLRFGAGIASTDLAVTRELDDIVIDLPAVGDQVRLSGWFIVAGGTVERVEFDDGSFWTAAELESQTVVTNQPPELANPIADQLATEDTAFSFTVPADAFADPDPGDTLAYTASLADGSPLPAWLGFDGPSRTFSGTPPGDSSGLLAIRVTVTDSGSESVFDDFVLDIANLVSGTAANDILTGTASRDVILGLGGYDQISAGDGDDTIDAGPGGAFITGGAGSDTVIFARGYGTQTLTDNESPAGNPDVLRFAADILPSDVTASRGFGASTVLQLRVTGTSDLVNLNKYFLIDTADPKAPRIEFGDGTIWEFDDIRPMVLIGSDSPDNIHAFTTDDYMDGQGGDDELHGYAGNDTLIGGAGADRLYGEEGDDILDGRPGVFGDIYSGDKLFGGTGNDTYRYGHGGGNTRIGEAPTSDPESGFDTILVDADLTPSQVLLQRDTETTLRLFLPDFSSILWVDGQFNRSGSGTATIEEIRFAADGTTWDMATINQMVATPTSGNDYLWGSDPVADFLQGFDGADRLYGFDGDDVLDGGPGADMLDGREGNDTYIFDMGYGADQIIEYSTSNGFDVVQFGTGIAPSSVTPTRSGDDLVMTLDGTSDQITMGIWFSSGFSTADIFIEEFRFADGTVWTDETIGALFPITGTAGADTLQGTLRATTLYGLGGNDTIFGNWRNDTLDGGAGADTLAGGPGNDTYIIDSTGDQALENPGEGIDTISTDLSWTLGANLENLTLTGSSNLSGTGNALDNTIIGNSGRNTLTGGAGNDWLDGGSNRDTLVGGTGDDTYVVDNGSDSITENANEGIDTVRSTLAWTLGSNLENLTLLGTANIDGAGNSLANVLTGNSGNNTLTGNAGNDTLDGQAGADTLVGGTGNDTYLLGRGHGADAIQENDATSGNTDIGQFLANVAPEQIWFRQSGSNLEVSIIGTPDQFTVQNWYGGSQYRLEQFRTEDGQTLMEAQVQNLVDAMAAFSPPPPGQETLPPEYATQLNPVIAANWQ